MFNKRKCIQIIFIFLSVLSTAFSVYLLIGFSYIHNSVATVSGSIPMSIGDPLIERVIISMAVFSIAGSIVFSILAKKNGKNSNKSDKAPDGEKT